MARGFGESPRTFTQTPSWVPGPTRAGSVLTFRRACCDRVWSPFRLCHGHPATLSLIFRGLPHCRGQGLCPPPTPGVRVWPWESADLSLSFPCEVLWQMTKGCRCTVLVLGSGPRLSLANAVAKATVPFQLPSPPPATLGLGLCGIPAAKWDPCCHPEPCPEDLLSRGTSSHGLA